MIAIFLFYSIANGKQSRMAFSKEFRHCNIITFDGAHWVQHDLDSYGIHTRVLKITNSPALLRALRSMKFLTAMIIVSIDKRARTVWKPFWVRSCNEFNRQTSGIDVGLTLNPSHLYRNLLKYDKRRNYEVLGQWRR